MNRKCFLISLILVQTLFICNILSGVPYPKKYKINTKDTIADFTFDLYDKIYLNVTMIPKIDILNMFVS